MDQIRFFFLTITLMIPLSLMAQCPLPSNNFQNFGYFDLTPTVQGTAGTQTGYATWGGDYHKVNVVTGETYEISTCDSGPYLPGSLPFNGSQTTPWPAGTPFAGQVGFDVGWDPQMTLIDGGSGTIVGFNDNYCGVYPAITYTASFTGELWVYLDSATLCDKYEIDSIVVSVTWLLGCTNSTNTINETVCGSYTVPSGDETYTTSGTYMDTIPNASGCDSILTINLTVNPLEDATFSYASSSYCMNASDPTPNITGVLGGTFTSSPSGLSIDASTGAIDVSASSTGNYTVTYTTAGACPNSSNVTVSVNSESSSTDVITACDSYTWIDGNTYTTSNNTATHTLTNAAGCDSVVTLNLTINSSTSATDVVSACDTYTWIDGNTYTSSNNTATHTLTNAAGCDSVVTLDLTINYSTSATEVVTACNSYTWIDGNTYTASNNTATHTLSNAAGCDSVVTLDLTITTVATGTDVITACDTYTWIDGNTYTASNNTATYTIVGGSVNGCDSIVTLDLTINNSTAGTDVITSCDTYTWIDGNTYTASNNTATHTLTNAAGCDSVVTLDLTINYSTSSTDVQTACDTYTWIDGNTYTASNNTATHTLTNAVGCDSVITLDLTINYSTSSTDVQTACNSFTWIDGNTYTTSNNTATHTLSNAVGCDSVITLDLTILTEVYGVDTQFACDSFTWIDGNTYYASNTTATDTLISTQGCDSIVTLDLYIDNMAPTASNPVTLYAECIDDIGTPSPSWVTDEADDHTTNPIVTFVGEVSDGQTCPETITRTFSVMDDCGHETLVTQTIVIDDETAPVPDVASLPTETAYCDVTLTAPTATDNCGTVITGTTTTSFPINTLGTTVVTWTFADACGNSVTQDQTVEIEAIDNSVTLASDQITLLAVNQNSGVTYQWIDCNTDQPISGATNFNYTPTYGSDFAVIISEGGCLDTSDCFNSTVGIAETNLGKIEIYPNPSSGIFTIELGKEVQGILTVRNTLGQTVLEEGISSSNHSVDLSKREPGVYLLRLKTNEGVYEEKLIKQ